jgi:DNA-directed RNA polymerase specialized sigma24 family protein
MKRERTTLEQLLKFQDRARRIAIYHRRTEHADDFAQEVALAFLEQPERRSTLDQLFVDYIRNTFGNSRFKKGRAQQRTGSIDSYSPNRFRVDAPVYDDRIARVASVAAPVTKRAIELYLEGWTMKQIGERLAVTECRICQLIAKTADTGTVRAIKREERELNDAA